MAHATPPGPASAGSYRLALTTTLATLILITMGGTVRATNSGLACPDWPACFGQWIPPAQLHIWLEHSHRLWAGVVMLLITWLAAWSVRRRREDRVTAGLAVGAFVLVLFQAGLGAAVVLLKLRAGLVSSHLATSLLVVACLVVIAVRTRPAAEQSPAVLTGWRADTPTARVGRRACLTAVLVLGQAILGAQATGHAAAFVYNAVPFWAADDAWTGSSRQVLHLLHRGAGYLVALAVLAFAVTAHRSLRARTAGGTATATPTVRAAVLLQRLSTAAAALVLLQVGLGLANVLTRAGVVSAVAHLSVAAWLWTVLVAVAALGVHLGDDTAAAEPVGAVTRPGGA